jgi:hypothetical protein
MSACFRYQTKALSMICNSKTEKVRYETKHLSFTRSFSYVLYTLDLAKVDLNQGFSDNT